MSEKTMFCFGYGYTAQALARRLRPDGWRMIGTTRSPEKAEGMRAEGVAAHLWNSGAFDSQWLDGANALLVSVSPNEQGCPAFRAAHEAIAAHRDALTWIGYLSTTGVYGDRGGGWVDEDSALRPTGHRGRRRVRAERSWQALGDRHQIPVAHFRLAGIYGPGRSAFDTIAKGRARRLVKPGQSFSRIHVDDIAQGLHAGLLGRIRGPVNMCDDVPAPPQEVIRLACEMLGIAPPPEQPYDPDVLSPMARSFYGDNKRVSNERLVHELGVVLRWPDYRTGLAGLKPDGSVRSAIT